MRGRKPSWIACWVSEKAPVITAWLAMTVATVARITIGARSAGGAMMKNQSGLAHRPRRAAVAIQRLQREGALAEVVQRQAGQDEEQPGRLDRPAAEMAHVGVERLGPGHGQEHRAQHQEADEAVVAPGTRRVDAG